MATINGTTKNDVLIQALSTADLIDGKAGDDSIDAGNGNNTVYGGAGADTIFSGTGNDWIDGGSQNDSISSGDGNDYVNGGSHNDTIDGGIGNDTLDGDSHDDSITGGAGDDSLIGGSGNDTVVAGADNDNVDGGSGNDSLTGNDGNDTIDGSSGNDNINGGLGNDTLLGGTGADSIVGDDGANYAPGETGAELVVNGSFENPDIATGSYLLTNSIPGWIIIGSDAELQDNYPGLGGAADGNQHVELDGTSNYFIGQFINTIAGHEYTFEFSLKARSDGAGVVPAGNDDVQVYWNGVLIDTVTATDNWEKHSYTVTGDGSLDPFAFVSTGPQDGYGAFLDAVSVKAKELGGDDFINGGTGNDTLTGGGGSDTFAFTLKDGSDHITDFQVGHDKVQLTGFTDYATDIAPHLTQVGANTVLDFGTGQVITFDNLDHTTLTAADFVFVV